MPLHPASRLMAWITLMILAQVTRASLFWGLGFLVCLAAMLLARGRSARLLRRIRILLLVLMILFAFFTPGELVLPFLGSAGPTQEGLVTALNHGARLVVLVLAVALMLDTTGEQALVSGLVTLARPLGILGLSADRLAVRMLLVFRYVETPPSGGWRALLTETSAQGGDVLRYPLVRMRWYDFLVMGALAVLLLAGSQW